MGWLLDIIYGFRGSEIQQVYLRIRLEIVSVNGVVRIRRDSERIQISESAHNLHQNLCIIENSDYSNFFEGERRRTLEGNIRGYKERKERGDGDPPSVHTCASMSSRHRLFAFSISRTAMKLVP